MTKIHFRPYNPNQTVLFPPRIDEDIAEHDPVRMVDALVESLNLESFRKLYKECGRSPYHPRMMLKVMEYVVGDEHTFDFWVQWVAPNGKIKAVRPKLVAWMEIMQ